MNALTRLSDATHALAEAKTLDEIKKIVDIAEAARTYAKAAKLGLEAQNHAAEVKLRAERKAGELLQKMEKNKGARGTGNNQYEVRSMPATTPTLTELNITKTQSSRWQQIATVPVEVFETFVQGKVSSEEELTTTSVLRVAKEQKREEKREDNRRLVEETKPIATIAKDVRYQTITIDPPWDWGDEGDADQLGRARPTYATMTIDQLLALPVADLACKDAHIYLWITNRSLPKGFSLLDKWGFRYITTITWCKPSIGMGNYFRGSTEQILFGVRGSLPILRKDMGTWFLAQRGERHSQKPDEFYRLVESCSPGPWLEMFARSNRNGWAAWGAEVDGL